MADDRKLATLTPEEDARWVDLFNDFEADGMECDAADEATWTQMQAEFPRLREFDGCTDETHI